MILRPATMEDADFLLMLKNDPVMRKFAVVSHKKIKAIDHFAWLFGHCHEISIIMEKRKPLGMFRVTKDKEVSINLAPEARGKGLGNKVMKYCPEGVWAKIVNGNVPSMKLFLNNGFKVTGYSDNYYVLQN